jgi:thiol-disulfide isomerase/thioredoxin
MSRLHWLLLVCLFGCTPSLGMGFGGTSGGAAYGVGMSGTPGMGGAPGMGAQQAPPSDPLAFMEWPTGLWWAQSDDRGHLVVLSAWGTSCRACVEALPQLESIARQFAGKGVHVYAINIEPDSTRFPALLRTLPAYPAILVDAGGQRLAAVLGLRSIPTVWVLDGNGKLAWTVEGWDGNSAAALSSKLAVLLGGGT